MGVLKSKVNINSAASKENYQKMVALVEELNEKYKEGSFQGDEKHITRARKRQKFLARERIELLLDRDSPFLELLPLAGMQNKNGFGAACNWAATRLW